MVYTRVNWRVKKMVKPKTIMKKERWMSMQRQTKQKKGKSASAMHLLVAAQLGKPVSSSVCYDLWPPCSAM